MMRGVLTRVPAFVVTAGLLPGAAWTQVPLGGEFQVNTYTQSSQYDPAVASAPDGSFMVVWMDTFHDGDLVGIFARGFDAAGLPASASEFQVNSYTFSSQRNAAVARTATGEFVVAWESGVQDGSGPGVFAQRYDASLLPLGGEFKVNAYTTDTQAFPTVSSAGGGGFFVGWSGKGPGGGSEIHGQLYHASGLARDGLFRINSYVAGGQFVPSATADATGNFVVVWMSSGQDGSGSGVFGQRFDPSAYRLGAEFAVNVYTTGTQNRPVVAASPSGDFVVVWHSAGDGDLYGVFARRYDANGAPQGPPYQVNEYTTGRQFHPAMTADGQGNFVVAWTSEGQDGSLDGVMARLLDASGLPVGSEFLVNSHTTGSQRSPAVSTGPTGGFVVAWESNGQDGHYTGIFAQRFVRDVIFRDGFDSASVSLLLARDLVVLPARP